MSSQKDVAAHLDLSSTHVRALVKREVLPQPERGRGYDDLDACRVAYIRHLREIAAARRSPTGADLTEERARLARAQAEAQEMKNAQLRGELVNRREGEEAQIALLSQVRAHLLQVHQKAAAEAHAASSVHECGEIFLRHQCEALQELADAEITLRGR